MRKRGRPISKEEIDLAKVYAVCRSSFGEKGFEGASTTAIAKKAGIARSLLHYYFGTKEDLWKSTMEQMIQRFWKEFEHNKNLYKDLMGVPLLKLIVRQIAYFFANNPAYMRMMSYEMMNPSSRTDWIIEHLLNPIFEMTAPYFQQERELGTIKKIAKENQIAILFGITSFFFNNAYFIQKHFRKNPFDKKEIDKQIDAVIEVFFNGIVHKTNKKNENQNVH